MNLEPGRITAHWPVRPVKTYTCAGYPGRTCTQTVSSASVGNPPKRCKNCQAVWRKQYMKKWNEDRK